MIRSIPVMKFIVRGCILSFLHLPTGEAFSVDRFHENSGLSRLTSLRLHSSTALVPEENPTADPNRLSLSGVKYLKVLEGLHALYPPKDLGRRNAASRTDGYWPFINKGEDPPAQFTYGEFDFYFFAELLDKAHEYYFQGREDSDKPNSWDDKVFVDIGSGTGRLVLAAAALHPGWKRCRGIEVLKGIHAVAEDTLKQCRPHAPIEAEEDEEIWVPVNGVFRPSVAVLQGNTSAKDYNEKVSANGFDNLEHYLPNPTAESLEDRLKLAPVHLSCGSFEDPYQYFGDADIVFVFSSCMSEGMMQGLSKSFGRQCKPGTIIITTEFQLPLEGTIEPTEDDPQLRSGSYKLELVESIDGYCWLTGGESTAIIHRMVESLWEEGEDERTPPEVTLEDQAYRAIKFAEAQNSAMFVRTIYNDMVFNDFPDHWLPKLQNKDDINEK